jgi:hypothetical protein
MATETLDRLYLEWSQFTTARTARELDLIAALDEAINFVVIDKFPGATRVLKLCTDALNKAQQK